MARRYQRHRPIATLIALLLCAGLLGADDVWKKKPAAQWTAKDALGILRDSPWAREQVVLHPSYRQGVEVSTGVGIELGGRRGQTERPPAVAQGYISASYLVRWESAVPVVQAAERLAELGEAPPRLYGPPPNLPEDRYVITVLLVRPPESEDLFLHHRDFFEELTTVELKQNAELKTKRATVEPLEVERGSGGPFDPIHFFFPRTHRGKPVLRVEEREFESVEFRVKGRMFSLKSKFNLPTHNLR